MRPLLLITVLPEQVHSNRKMSHPRHTWVLTWAEHGGHRGGIWAPQALCLLFSNTPVLGNEQHVGFKFKHFLFINIALNMGIKLCIILSKITWMLTAHNNKSLLRALRGAPSHTITLPSYFFFTCRCPICLSSAAQPQLKSAVSCCIPGPTARVWQAHHTAPTAVWVQNRHAALEGRRSASCA